jgi:hypothetical protein
MAEKRRAVGGNGGKARHLKTKSNLPPAPVQKIDDTIKKSVSNQIVKIIQEAFI